MTNHALHRGATYVQTIAVILVIIVVCAYLIHHPDQPGLIGILHRDIIFVWLIMQDIGHRLASVFR